MIDEEFFMILEGSSAIFSDQKELPLSRIGLPEYISSFRAKVIWRFRITKYFPEEKRASIKILSYSEPENVFSNRQNEVFRNNPIDTISIRVIDTTGWLQSTNGNIDHKSQMIHSVPPYSIKSERNPNSWQVTEKLEPVPFIATNIEKVIPFDFHVQIKDVQFLAGSVKLLKHIPEVGRIVEIRISNPKILEEFDAVKNYIAKMLNTKKISVIGSLVLVGLEVRSVTALSHEISLIDEAMFGQLRLDVLRHALKSNTANSRESLIPLDQLLESIQGEKVKTRFFYSNDEKIVEDIIEITDSKHYRQLRFLSSKHLHKIMRLRFSPQPFSFLFLLEGRNRFHLIWETLRTEEATYIWNVPKTTAALKDALTKIDAIIASMRVNGKRWYINTTEDDYNRINHDYSEPIEGFKQWKIEIEAVLENSKVE